MTLNLTSQSPLLSGMEIKRQTGQLKAAVESAVNETKRKQHVFETFMDALHASGFDVVQIPEPPPHTSSEIGHG